MRYPVMFCFLLVPASLFAQTADEKKATVKFLVSLQQPDGGFVPGPIDPRLDAIPRSSLRATSAAVRSIQYLGGEVPNRDRAIEFVNKCSDPATGGYSDAPGGKPDATVTAIGIMAAAALQKEPRLDKSMEYLVKHARTFEERRLAVAGMEAAGKFPPVVKEWLAEVEKGRNADGTYGKQAGQARDTGGVAAMILRSGGKLSADHRKAIVAALRAGQRADGGFGTADVEPSDPATTYRVMRAFHLLGEKPKDVARLKEFLAKRRNADGGYALAPGQPSTVSGTYFAAIIGYWLDK